MEIKGLHHFPGSSPSPDRVRLCPLNNKIVEPYDHFECGTEEESSYSSGIEHGSSGPSPPALHSKPLTVTGPF